MRISHWLIIISCLLPLQALSNTKVLCTDDKLGCIADAPVDADTMLPNSDAVNEAFDGATNADNDQPDLAANNLSHMPQSFNTDGQKTFVFDPRRLAWGAYDENGDLINSGRASGGKNYCPDLGRRCRTPIGNFTVQRKGPASCRSSKFPLGRGGAPMPYCMFFHHGFAIHGSYDVPNRHASRGCVRVQPDAARWLHTNFIDHGTRVIVKPY